MSLWVLLSRYVITKEEMQPVEGNTLMKNDFESTGSIYVNTNRKYSPEYVPGNLLELEANHLLEQELCTALISQKTNRRITYPLVPETKYNLAESCVNVW